MADFYAMQTMKSALPYATQAQGGQRFVVYDDRQDGITYSADPLRMNANGLLGKNQEEEEEDPIPYDEQVLAFHVTRNPDELGQELELSRKNGLLAIQSGTQSLDLYPETEFAPGKHDLVKRIELHMSTTCKAPFVAAIKSVPPLGDEAFYNYQNPLERADHVALTLVPQDFHDGPAKICMLDRPITHPMRSFLERYPGHTADTLNHSMMRMPKSDNVMVQYNGSQGQSSPVMMWYNGLVNDNNERVYPPLRPDENGWVTMHKEVYAECEKHAKREISRYISLGDVTSKDFALVIAPFSPLKKDVTLGDFELHYPNVRPDQRVRDVDGSLVPALDRHLKTPIQWSGRLIISYKKVHDGTNE